MSAPTDETTKITSSQEIIDKFWKTNISTVKPVAKSPSVLPNNVYTQLVKRHQPKGDVGGRSVTASYFEAVKECETKVAQIVAECRRNNKKYSDPHFDLEEWDCKSPLCAAPDGSDDDDAQQGNPVTFEITQKGTSTGGPITWGNIQPQQQQMGSGSNRWPGYNVKRVEDIFDNPKFYVDGVGVKDVRQGAEGDCWFLSSLGSLCVEQSSQLIQKVCPEKARDEKVGVYGFVFYRDGEWISEIVDDKLYLSAPDYDDCDDARRSTWDNAHGRLDPDVSREEYRKTYQRNSDALEYGSCADPNETWVPLIEKAFAKAHGDYKAISGGFPGEGIEDLTGGITTEILTADILDKDLLWTEGLLKVNKEFLFGTGTRDYGYEDPRVRGRQGIQDGHAYSVLRAVDYGQNRLLLMKNPWGQTEWNGPWSDGSKEWTPEALKALNYTFGDDGIFWISYEHFLRRYNAIWRTRLFTPDWNVSQHWTTVQVPWSGHYNDTKFEFVLAEPTRTVIVLSKLDERYFKGLTGQYQFDLAFRLHRSGEDSHIIRGYSSGDRSADAEVDLEAGTYEVLLQISGMRYSSLSKIEDVVKYNWLWRRDKLIRIGLSYDLAHAKGQVENTEKKTEEKVEKDVASVPPTSDNALPTTSADNPPATNVLTDTTSAPTPAPDPAPTPAPAPAPTPQSDPEKPTAIDDTSPAADAWNASCVVGLRVFCHKAAATIRVVAPEPKDVTMASKPKLDIDDPEKDAAEKVDTTGINEAKAEKVTTGIKEAKTEKVDGDDSKTSEKEGKNEDKSVETEKVKDVSSTVGEKESADGNESGETDKVKTTETKAAEKDVENEKKPAETGKWETDTSKLAETESVNSDTPKSSETEHVDPDSSKL